MSLARRLIFTSALVLAFTGTEKYYKTEREISDEVISSNLYRNNITNSSVKPSAPQSPRSQFQIWTNSLGHIIKTFENGSIYDETAKRFEQ